MKSAIQIVFAFIFVLSVNIAHSAAFPFSVGDNWKYKSYYSKTSGMGSSYHGTSKFTITKITQPADSIYRITVRIVDSIAYFGKDSFWIATDAFTFLWNNGIGTDYSVDYRGRFLSIENRTGQHSDTLLTGTFHSGSQYRNSYDPTFGTTMMYEPSWSANNPGCFRYDLESMNDIAPNASSTNIEKHISNSTSAINKSYINGSKIAITYSNKFLNGRIK